MGSYQFCPSSGDCVLIESDCGKCGAGQYLCPNQKTCVNSAEEYTNCPGLAGTHLDWLLPVEERVEYLADQASLEEQIAQLTNDASAIPRLGIPSYNWLNDDEHGVRNPDATSFPSGCNLGASFSKKTLFEVGEAIGMESRALYNGNTNNGNRGHQVNGAGITLYAPNLNLVRDPRWGRAQEVFSEDPVLTGELTKTFVEGAQGSERFLLSGMCCKHYAAYDLESIPVNRFVFDAKLDVRNTWETYFPAFKSCFAAGATHAMCSYNAINGVPTCADGKLMNDVLRTQWKWKGFVVSDYDAWANIYTTHKYCDSMECAAAVGINAGMDQEGGGTEAINQLQKALQDKLVTVDAIATAFKRLFTVRINLGMHDPPLLVPWNLLKNDSSIVRSRDHLDLALRSAQMGICLFKNSKNVLPLKSPKKVAVLGWSSFGTTLLQGNYITFSHTYFPSIVQAIDAQYGGNMKFNCSFETAIEFIDSSRFTVDSGNLHDCAWQCTAHPECKSFSFEAATQTCYHLNTISKSKQSVGFVSGICGSPAHQSESVLFAPGCMDTSCTDSSHFPEAIAAAKQAEAVVIVLGTDQSMEREGFDRAVIELPDGQYDLVRKVRAATTAPLIVVLVNGGSVAMNPIIDQVDAIVEAWFPGEQGGVAVKSVLFGEYNPAGRSAVTNYKSTQQLPPMDTMNLYATNDSIGLTYRYFEGEPLFPFGFGLSFTSFEYSDLTVPESAHACDSIPVTVKVTNTGEMTGDEVVQLYVKTPDSSVPTPNVRLVDFTRVIQLGKGQTTIVSLTIQPEFHSVVYDGADIYHPKIAIEKGVLQVFVGGGQPDFSPTLEAKVNILETRPLNQC